jgi:hypothetical protein
MVSGLVGRALNLDEEIEIEEFVGRSYLIVVAAADNGGSRVDAVIAAPAS